MEVAPFAFKSASSTTASPSELLLLRGGAVGGGGCFAAVRALHRHGSCHQGMLVDGSRVDDWLEGQAFF
jgi:hypothetical protein